VHSNATVLRIGVLRQPDWVPSPPVSQVLGARSSRKLDAGSCEQTGTSQRSCRHRCRRKEPLPSNQRFALPERRRGASTQSAGRDSFRDNRGDIRQAVNRDLLILSFLAAVRWLRRWFAKRRSAFRPSSFFPASPRVTITSSIERVGCCWLWRPGFGAPQGQSWGQLPR
jgi:hypothetical protein